MKLAAFLSIAVLFLIACEQQVEDNIDKPIIGLTAVEVFMTDASATERGRALFAGSCSSYCHTLTPTDTDASYLFDCEWTHGGSDQEIIDIVTSGIPNTRMVGFGSNFPEQNDVLKIIAYLRLNQKPCE